jgi:hypothetical protein
MYTKQAPRKHYIAFYKSAWKDANGSKGLNRLSMCFDQICLSECGIVDGELSWIELRQCTKNWDDATCFSQFYDEDDKDSSFIMSGIIIYVLYCCPEREKKREG